MQLAYQFPERVERLVLVSSGGLGREVGLVLRAATLPGAEWVLPVLTRRGAARRARRGRPGAGPARAAHPRRRARDRARARVARATRGRAARSSTPRARSSIRPASA